MNRALRKYAAVGVLPLALLLGSCTDQEEPEVPEVPGETEQPTDGADPTGTGDPTADPTSANVPFECGDLISAGQVVQIVKTSLDGETRRVYNDELLEDSGRTARLTCQYGVPTRRSTASPKPGDKEPKASVEIAVSSYTDAEIAAGRIDSTVGGTSRNIKQQTVAGNEGYLLTGEGEVTFVVAKDVRTYVITIRRGLVPKAAERAVILELAGDLLGVPEATPTS